jgi:hypothetical protein
MNKNTLLFVGLGLLVIFILMIFYLAKPSFSEGMDISQINARKNMNREREQARNVTEDRRERAMKKLVTPSLTRTA